ncbi:hypothetical protein HBI65_176280 [Parastagonospora nodorum]|nr:hypothetical protein HBH46_125590 [Parastagonospora nodorum]KAH5242676.1 hypothetical protein HBI72_194480 [Parastagonospora nodorum]KAH6088815.1 hypothetical protein HBI65_176280 [Parastagonospora nodorum]
MVLLYIFLLAAGAGAVCHEASIAHPLPDLDPNDAVLKHAFATIDTDLESAIAAPEFVATSFSVEITSSKESLWAKHHTARERNASRPSIPEVNGDALYRIASITKTFTVLGILYQHKAGNLSLDDPVDKYIKELKEDREGNIAWKDITLRSLASQLSGIPREFAQSDFINHNQNGLPDPLDIGLPPLSREGLIDCDEYSKNYEKPCHARDLLHALKSKHPLFAPNKKSTYSNLAFDLLGLVLSRVSNKTYETYIEDAIFKPLDMSKSTLSLPPDSAGVIPLDPHFWDVDEGIQNPTGGIYTSTNDMSKYLRYVLTHYNDIVTGVNWLNPVSPSEGLHSFYGMPWEILHTDRVLKNSRRTVRFITKGGGLPGYFSVIAVVPEYDLACTILIAGEYEMLSKVQDAVGATIVRAAEEIAIRQLEERYTGTYTSTNQTLNSTITLVADERGLVVERLIANGTDALEGAFKTSPRQYIQVVPTLQYQDEQKKQGENWRIVHSYERTVGEGSIWDDYCIANIDGEVYAGTSPNELVFWNAEEEGKFAEVELSAFRVNLTRSDEAQELVEL